MLKLVALLSVFYKILERRMYKNIYKYIMENNLLYNKQFGFQSNNSTENAILNLVDDISNAFDRIYTRYIYWHVKSF